MASVRDVPNDLIEKNFIDDVTLPPSVKLLADWLQFRFIQLKVISRK